VRPGNKISRYLIVSIVTNIPCLNKISYLIVSIVTSVLGCVMLNSFDAVFVYFSSLVNKGPRFCTWFVQLPLC